MKASTRKWITIAILATAAGIIFELPYMRYTFYDPLREGLKLSHEQFGELMSFYGTLAFIFYIPSGWLADRVSHKWLLGFSLIGTGLGGFYLSTWPSFTGARVLFAFWGITTIFTFWSALLKATSLLGDKSEQGKLFSLTEGGRGIITSLSAIIATAMIAQIGATPDKFVYVLYLYSIICVLTGVAAIWLVPHNKGVVTSEEKSSNILKDMVDVAKMPITWLLAVCIFSIYTVYTTSSYFTPYMTEVFGVSAATAAVVATFKNHLFRPISGIVGTFLTTKTGSSIPAMKYSILFLAVLIGAVLLLPISASFVLIVSVVIALIGLMTFVLRGLYFAPVGEVGTPKRFLGAAMGLISCIAFTSDIFNFKIVGRILDNNPGVAGYKIVFIYILVLLATALVSLMVLKKRAVKHDSNEEEIA
ncbi:MFS transporter [Proteiniclasticum sp. BAD-10]|uniref:MFS transporter n=1 Tax=Proteiniclasticum sediminis TaxID=2804028 RepID=A0A941CTP2_9CLOT|nr:MFS transporter [Proteiniclasticum sediminis]MBR0577384.1 MFS transporter [Proteiniclasticum sediminis]